MIRRSQHCAVATKNDHQVYGTRQVLRFNWNLLARYIVLPPESFSD
jgi:hypothetical protein